MELLQRQNFEHAQTPLPFKVLTNRHLHFNTRVFWIFDCAVYAYGDLFVSIKFGAAFLLVLAIC